MRKNAALEASNVAVLLEHIPVGQTRSVHSLQVTRVEPDHYSIGGGRVVDLVDAISQIGQYSGHGAANMRSNPSTARLLTQMQLAQLVNEAQAPFPANDHLTVAEWMAYLDNQDMIEKVGDKYRLSSKITQEDVRDALYASGGHRLYSNPSSESHVDYARTYLDRSRYYEQKGDMLNAYDAAVKAVANLEGVIREADAPVEARPLYEKCEKQQRNLRKKLFDVAQKTAKPTLRSNPQKAERGYFYEVLDKRGDVVMLTTTKAEAEEICADPAAFKLRKGGTFTLRHVGARSALEGPPIKRI